jgi:hypothetical protein
MNGLFEAAREVQQFFRKKRWRFCLIGGLAVTRWGEPRATQDVDFSLLVEAGKESKVVAALLEEFEPRISDAREFALENRVVLCTASNGVAVDIALACLPFEKRVMARASRFTYARRCVLATCSAEDLIVMKAIADRDQDWVDVRGIVQRQGNKLDWRTIQRELRELCALKEDTAPLERLKLIRAEERE